MDQKPVIQYVGQFYVYGSEVKVKKRNEPKRPLLPSVKTTRERKVYIDPVAVGGIALAVCILVALVVGGIRLSACMTGYNAAEETLSELKRENARLEHAYRTSLNLETVKKRAEELGMIPQAEAAQASIRVTVPEHKGEPGAWENFVWFISGLLAPTEAPVE